MPKKDPEKYKEYMREQMRQRRMRAKAQKDSSVQDSKPSTDALVASTKEIGVTPSPKAPAFSKQEVAKTAPATKIPEKPARLPNHIYDSEGKDMGTLINQPVTEMIRKTEEKLATRGWVLWQLNNRDGERIVIVRDSTVDRSDKMFPKGYPVYEVDEIPLINDKPIGELKFLNQVKIATEAKYLGQERLF